MSGDAGGEGIELPIVTVFGAGIAGLTAAHELVERGFKVQVVEPGESEFGEYECAVGGLASNQFSRVRAAIADLHPGLHPERLRHDVRENLARVEDFRGARTLEQTSKRFPLRQHIRFDKRLHDPERRGDAPRPPHYDEVLTTPCEPQGAVPPDWRDYWDDHGTLNRRKLDDVLVTIREAVRHYMSLYFPALRERLALGTDPTDEEWLASNFAPMRGSAELGRRFVARETLLVRIVGYTDTDGTAGDNRRLANAWATRVRDSLIALNEAAPADLRVWHLKDQLDVVVRGSASPRYDQSSAVGRNRSNRVEFEVVEQVIPGEHGFRFFPSFYRHLFDTMRRTPIFNTSGDPANLTAFDQLVPTPHALLARDDGKGPQIARLRGFNSIRQLDDTVRLLCDQYGFTPRDLLGLQYHMLRYLFSSPERRLHEAEPINLLKYIGGDDPSRRFSKAALDFINRAPRALAAMSAIESDARTQLNATTQLMIAPPADDVTADMTLNGPTSTAWLGHWKDYLKIQGVKFFVGRIKSLEVLLDRFVPVVEGLDGRLEPHPENAYDTYLRPGGDGRDLGNHRFILALPFQEASDLIWAAYNCVDPLTFTGPFRQLVEFDKLTGRREDGAPGTRHPVRDPVTGKPPEKYPLRTISGLQYFFTQEYRFGQGNVYFVSAPWALTSISQFAYWRDRIRPVGAFLGQISVDVGDWHAFYPPDLAVRDALARGHTAWYSSLHEIAEKTWQQIKSGLAKDYADVIRAPRYFHIDRNIVFSETADSGFQGPALLRISQPNSLASPDADRLTFNVSVDRWSQYRVQSAAALNVRFGWHALSKVPTRGLADTINNQFGASLFSIPHAGSTTDVLVSPMAIGTRFVIAFRGAPKSVSHIVVNTSVGDLIKVKRPAERLEALRRAVAGFPDKVSIQPLDEDHSTFEVKRDDEAEFRATVLNEDGVIELLDGPRLDVRISSPNIQLINAMHPGSGRITSAAVRGNAILRLPTKRQEDAPNGLQAGRLYGVAVGVAHTDAMVAVKYEAKGRNTPDEVRDELLAQLRSTASDIVVARPIKDAGIVLSPVVDVQETVINILGSSSELFLVRIGNHPVEVSGSQKSKSEIRDAIAAEIRGKVGDQLQITPIAEHSLRLVCCSPGSFKIGVLNSDRMIELVGAPALTVEAKDVRLQQPKEGFIVLRNDAEFLINIPDQWGRRPGLLRRGAASEVPHDYAGLAGCFGAEGTEIFYGHHNCRLLEHWVAAGTYMATYTRITTMEAANESGRHAASAIIYTMSKHAAQNRAGRPALPHARVLVGDFPQIWKVEDNEPEDFKYFTQLDRQLFADNLPHFLDILSVTRLLDALLEADMPQEQMQAFMKACTDIFGALRGAINQGVLTGGRAFSDMVGAYCHLTEGILDVVASNSPLQELVRPILRPRLEEVQRLNEYYRAIWFRGG